MPWPRISLKLICNGFHRDGRGGDIGMTFTKKPGQRSFKLRERGFSVLEAMIAMAILAAAMLPLLSLQGQFIKSVESFERVNIRIEMRENAMAILRTKNFTYFPKGQADIGDVHMQWEASRVEAARRTKYAEDNEARFQVSLYDVHVRIVQKDGSEEKFIVRGLGWHPLWRQDT